MNFFFVYDTAFCTSDEEDPKDAVVLFFPVQASESQGHFLCCQLAGVAKFLKTTFAAPSVIGLDQGKFVFFWSGNYLLGLGASCDVHTSVLKDQLVFLCGIFCFYHGNMRNVLKECKDNRYDFLLKLELSWSRYVTLTQGFGNVLQMSLQSLPLKTGKKGSSAVANRLLHLCQLSSCVTTGAVFYNSRVLASQFLPQFTNYLSLLSNSNASAPVSDAGPHPTPLPPDVQLKYVYLSPSSPVRQSGPRAAKKHRRSRTCSAPVGGSTRCGSEGDVDSGNGSESVSWSQGWKWRNCVSRLDSWIHCCTFHERLFEKRASRNTFLRSSGIHPSKREYGAAVPCPLHARLLSSATSRHSDATSTADYEFRCALCRSYNRDLQPSSLKKWNSDPELSRHWSTVSSAKERPRSTSECTTARRSKSKRRSTDPPKRSGFCGDIEENDLERHVLYVQRYGGSTLVLLLRRHYDEKAVNYLWNCGFSVLRELEVKCEGSESPYNIEPSFYILLYNHVKGILKEYPHYPSLLLTEKHSRQTIQKVQEEFKMDPKFLTICLLSSHYSMFASHKDPDLAFYLQPESNSRKLDPLVHLQAKATRRLAKYFKVNPV